MARDLVENRSVPVPQHSSIVWQQISIRIAPESVALLTAQRNDSVACIPDEESQKDCSDIDTCVVFSSRKLEIRRKDQLEKKMKEKIMSFLRDERGLTTVEYAVAGALVAVAVVLAFQALGVGVGGVVADLTTAVNTR